jgi:hypothetical protein
METESRPEPGAASRALAPLARGPDANGDQSRACRRGIAPGDRVEARSVALDRQPGVLAQRWPGAVSVRGLRRCGLTPVAAAEGVRPCGAPEAVGGGGSEAVRGLVTAADFGMAARRIHRLGADAGVTRDDLPEPLPPGARLAEEGAGAPSSLWPPVTPLQARDDQGSEPRRDQGRGVDLRPTSGSGVPGGAWPPGGRPARRLRQHAHRNAGGAAVALRNPCEGGLEGHADGGEVAPASGAHAAETAASDADVGLEMALHRDFTVATNVRVYFRDPQSPWQQGTKGNPNLLLSQYSPKAGGPVGAHAGAPRPRRAEAQRQASTGARLQVAGVYDQSERRDNPLRRQCVHSDRLHPSRVPLFDMDFAFWFSGCLTADFQA